MKSGNKVEIIGTNNMITRPIIIVITKGRVPRNIVKIGTSLNIPLSAKTCIPNGGVMPANIMVNTHITPKCNGSKPTASTIGNRIGKVMTSTA